MKNILVPVDFSENSRNAVSYAVEIATRFRSHIHLLHTYRVPAKTGAFISLDQYILDDVRPDMQRLEEWVGERAPVSSGILRDTLPHAVAILSAQMSTRLIVMGTQGASGLKEIFIGSNTAAVLNQSAVPMLVIPAGFEFRPIRTIVFAVDDFDISSLQVVAPLTRLAKGMQSRVLVYHLNEEGSDSGVDPSVDIFLDGVEHSFHFETEAGAGLNERINAFVRESQADLLCMVRRPRGFFERLFRGSVTRKEVFHSPVPLLVLMERKG